MEFSPDHDWTTLHRRGRGRGNVIETHAGICKEVEKRFRVLLDNQRDRYDIVEIKPVLMLHESRPPATIEREMPQSAFYPLLTVHATQDVQKVESIAHFGYRMPGELHPMLSYPLRMANGAMFGEGVYSSTDIDLARWFSYVDAKCQIQLIVNLVFMGNVHFVGDDVPDAKLVSTEAGVVCRQSYYSSDITQGMMHPVHGEYVWKERTHKDGEAVMLERVAHTRATAALDYVISGASEYVLPILVVTLKPKWSCSYFGKFLKLKRNGRLIAVSDIVMPYAYADAPVVPFLRVLDDLYVVQLPDELYKDSKKIHLATNDGVEKKHILLQPRTLRHHVIVPALSLLDHGSKETFASFVGSLCADDDTAHYAVLYDDTKVRGTHVHNVDEFRGASASFGTVAHGKGKDPCILEALDTVCETIEKSEAHQHLNVVHVFVSPACAHSTRSVQQLIEKHEGYMRVQDVIVKLVFLGNDQSANLAYVPLKSAFQNQYVYEEISYTVEEAVQARTLQRVCQELLTEQARLNVGRGVPVTIPFPLGVHGEGFLVDLTSAPLWDVEMCTPTTLYKGRRLDCIRVNGELCRTIFSDAQALIDAGVDGENSAEATDEEMEEKAMEEEWNRLVAQAKQHGERKPKKRGWRRKWMRSKAYRDYMHSLKQLVAQKTVVSGVYSEFGAAITRLLFSFRLHVLRAPDSVRWFVDTVNVLCNSVLEEATALVDGWTRATGDYDLSEMRRTVATLVKLRNEITLFSSVDFGERWLKGIQAMRYGKKALKRVQRGTDLALPAGVDALDVLTNIHARGLGIRVRRVAASDVEPWRVIVDHVFHERVAVSKLVMADEMRRRVHVGIGERRQRVTDAVDVDWSECGDIEVCSRIDDDGYPRKRLQRVVVPSQEVQRIYHSYVFTRNPYLPQSAQLFALRGVALVRAVEMVFRREYLTETQEERERIGIPKSARAKRGADKTSSQHSKEEGKDASEDEVAAVRERNRLLFVNGVWELTRVIAATGNDAEALGWIRDIAEESNLGALSSHLTTKSNVQSLCRLLCAMLDREAATLLSFRYDDERFARVAFLMLAECCARAARIRQRRFNLGVSAIVRDVMQLNEETAALDSTFTYDAAACARRTNRFFARRYANCTPFAVVSMIGLIQRWHHGQTCERVFEALWSRDQVSMRGFLAACLPDYADRAAVVQLALFLHSVRYHSASMRNNVDFSRPERIIDEIVTEERMRIAAEVATRDRDASRRERRLALRRAEASPFTAHHARVRLFTEAELSALNATRDDNDKLELMPGGLLRHHCAYVDCPHYLTNFRSEKDAMRDALFFAAGGANRRRTRLGLMNHLRFDHVNGYYVRSFHLSAPRLFDKHTDTQDTFVQKCMIHFKKQAYSDGVHIDLDHLKSSAVDLYNYLVENRRG